MLLLGGCVGIENGFEGLLGPVFECSKETAWKKVMLEKRVDGVKKATALGVPRRSPIQVLAELNAA